VAEVMTVTGPVRADTCGRTLPHEHLFINEMREMRSVGLVNDEQMLAEELAAFVAAGGKTIVELTTTELTGGAAPDPGGYLSGVPDSGLPVHGSRAVNHVHATVELAKRTGINIVLGTGHYRDPYFDDGWLVHHSVEQVAKRMCEDALVGFPGTRVRAGVIGEIGADKWFISALEERSFRAAALAHLDTGLTITTHAARWPVGIPQLDLLTAAGVDPRRITVGHCGNVNIPEYHLELARRGAYVQFDTIRGQSAYDIRIRADFVVNLRSEGYLDRVLLSHDICEKDQMMSYGGCGYSYLFEHFCGVLRQRGLAEEEVEQLITVNPQRALSD
jgi:predicted metal-dependent phosphotriesterase family hydrolase